MDSQRKHLPADERRAVTVETVIKLAAEQNPNEITTAAIAASMNLTQGALFRHFPSKDAIWQAVMDWVTQHLLARVDEAARNAASPLAALEAIYMAHIGFVAEHPGVPRMLFGELQRAEGTATKRIAQTLIRQYGARLVALIKDGQAAGELDAELQPEAAATLFIGSIQGLVMQALLVGDTRRMRKDAAGALAIYRRGIASVRK